MVEPATVTYPPPKALLRLPPSRNKRVRSGIAAIRLLLRKTLLQEAAVQLQQLQQLDPANIEIALLQAELLTLAGDHDRSCQLLKQILSRHPGLVPALVLSARHTQRLNAILMRWMPCNWPMNSPLTTTALQNC